MSKGIVTEYEEICIFCGRPAECEHHLIFGTAGRELSEKDGLKVPACNNCHNMGDKLKRVHDNPIYRSEESEKPLCSRPAVTPFGYYVC